MENENKWNRGQFWRKMKLNGTRGDENDKR